MRGIIGIKPLINVDSKIYLMQSLLDDFYP